jgi:hypothetical protein
MKPYIKVALGIIGLAAVVSALLAADVRTTYSTYATNSRVPLDYSGSNSIGASASGAVMAALKAQALLLKEMLQDHQRRAADLAQKNESDKAKWETDLVNELQQKTARVQQSIDQTAQGGPTANDMKAGRSNVDDQLAFVSMIEARLEQVREQVSAATGDIRSLSMQIATNKSPEEIAAMSSALGENQRLINELQRERFDLALREVEFRAICKAVQK